MKTNKDQEQGIKGKGSQVANILSETMSLRAENEMMKSGHASPTPKAKNIHYFKSGKNILSNFSNFRLLFRETYHKSPEHCYQWMKARTNNDNTLADKILRCTSPSTAKFLGSKVTASTYWHETKVGLMEEIFLARAKQQLAFRQALLNTGNKELIHNIEGDDFWGFGTDGTGANMQGVILMSVRD